MKFLCIYFAKIHIFEPNLIKLTSSLEEQLLLKFVKKILVTLTSGI